MSIVSIKAGSIKPGSTKAVSIRTDPIVTSLPGHGLLAVLIPVLIIGCGSTSGTAPVLDRTPAPTVRDAKKPDASSVRNQAPARPAPTANTTSSSATPDSAARTQSTAARSASRNTAGAAGTDDWRPDYYTVRRGDTLYSIALDFGHDYRDLAAWNNLANASYIQVGQRLRLFPPPARSAPSAVALPAATLPGAGDKRSASVSAPLFADPKAYRSAYSEQALSDMRRILAGEIETAVVATAPVKGSPAQVSPVQSSPAPAPAAAAAPPRPTPPPARQPTAAAARAADEALKWEWPAPGELLYSFAKGPIKKGVGIRGNPGQSVVSSAPGKVVYSGSGLRGYGNLIIVKHNDTYLSVYAHNQQLLVSEGQMVAQGQKIAVMGEISAGRTGLHFEIRRLGKPIDPLAYLPDRRS